MGKCEEIISQSKVCFKFKEESDGLMGVKMCVQHAQVNTSQNRLI